MMKEISVNGKIGSKEVIKMWIRYRDKLGNIIREIGNTDTIAFLSGSVFFTTIDGDDMVINVNDLMEIGRCAE